ncbi:hypothetical protein H8B02_18845 [Bradyrhizobium sp. Pear77]|uniref:hypothetical protein n=1 Tax=Bradyrhizobium altum TaxID=1571202 RepID=UPI001E301FEC|nr:hypothetical protein [Bradyrhizobium altum]MCC8955413.1 hypothetical protein [Bradyrhizobium altum]
MIKHDVTKTNIAIERLLETTTTPRHRFLLMAYHRHRYLEIAGRYEEIFAPEMMSENPAYHVHAGGNHVKLVGQDAVKNLYRTWADTNQSIFYTENEQIAVADNFVASTSIFSQQVSGSALALNKATSYLPGFLAEAVVKRVLARKAVEPDENSMYLYSNFLEMIWPYDDRGRLIGEDVWEPDPDKADIVKLDPADVVTTTQAEQRLRPLIKPLPTFDEMVLRAKSVSGAG